MGWLDCIHHQLQWISRGTLILSEVSITHCLCIPSLELGPTPQLHIRWQASGPRTLSSYHRAGQSPK